MKYILATFAILLSLAGCVTASGIDVVAFHRQSAIDLSVYELLGAPEKYDGRSVRVIGVASFSFMYEGFSGIYATPDDFERQTNGVIEISSFEPSVGKNEQDLVRLIGKYVVLEGVFHARPPAPEQPTDGSSLVCIGRCWGGGYIEQLNRVSLWQY